jgi:hypothetical protein
MAIPQNAQYLSIVPQRGGIGLVIVPSSDPTCDVELWRKGATESTALYTLIAPLTQQQLKGQQYKYVDPVPVDGRAWDYVGRHTAQDRSPSTFSASVRRKAVSLPTVMPPIPQLSGQGMPADVFISTGRTFKLGTKQNPKTVAKTLVIPASQMIPRTSTMVWAYSGTVSGEYLYPNSLNPQDYVAPAILPPGVTLTQVSLRAARLTTGSSVILRLWKHTGGGAAASNLAVVTATTGFSLTASSVFSELVGSTMLYFMQVELDAVTSALNSRFYHAKLHYSMPSYDKGI